MSLPRIRAGDSARASLRDESELLLYRIATADSAVRAVPADAARDRAMTHARSVKDAHAIPDDAVEPEPFRFVHGLIVGLAISAFLWAMLAALGYAAYMLVTRA